MRELSFRCKLFKGANREFLPGVLNNKVSDFFFGYPLRIFVFCHMLGGGVIHNIPPPPPPLKTLALYHSLWFLYLEVLTSVPQAAKVELVCGRDGPLDAPPIQPCLRNMQGCGSGSGTKTGSGSLKPDSKSSEIRIWVILVGSGSDLW